MTWPVAILAIAMGADGPRRIEVVGTPDGGIQPQAVAGRDGVIHLLSFKGDPAAGDLDYTRSEPGRSEFAPGRRVNSVPKSAIAIGTVRGGQIALGRGGRVHVAWNGTAEAKPANPIKGAPMLYARLEAKTGAFEPQRNLMRRTFGLDGGGTVAADDAGNVYVGWHGRAEDSAEGETGRAFWVARSTDDGRTFAAEEPALGFPTGACACCGTRALTGRDGNLYALYRAARGGTGRDMLLLASADGGRRFEATTLQPWPATICPMSTEALVEGPEGVVAAWETKGQVAFARIDPKTRKPSKPVSPPGGGGNRKHPAVAVNAQGEALLVWAEGTGWQKGGALAWQLFDASGQPREERGRVERAVPVWSLPTVVARPDGSFLIFY